MLSAVLSRGNPSRPFWSAHLPRSRLLQCMSSMIVGYKTSPSSVDLQGMHHWHCPSLVLESDILLSTSMIVVSSHAGGSWHECK